MNAEFDILPSTNFKKYFLQTYIYDNTMINFTSMLYTYFTVIVMESRNKYR